MKWLSADLGIEKQQPLKLGKAPMTRTRRHIHDRVVHVSAYR